MIRRFILFILFILILLVPAFAFADSVVFYTLGDGKAPYEPVAEAPSDMFPDRKSVV